MVGSGTDPILAAQRMSKVDMPEAFVRKRAWTAGLEAARAALWNAPCVKRVMARGKHLRRDSNRDSWPARLLGLKMGSFAAAAPSHPEFVLRFCRQDGDARERPSKVQCRWHGGVAMPKRERERERDGRNRRRS